MYIAALSLELTGCVASCIIKEKKKKTTGTSSNFVRIARLNILVPHTRGKSTAWQA